MPLNVNQLTYHYRDAHAPFTLQFDFTLPTGEILAVLGPSGAGKSSLLAMLGGFLTPEQGDACWDAQSFISEAPHARPLSMLFQEHNLFPHLSVAQNIGLGIHPGLKLTDAQWQQVENACNSVGLNGMLERQPHTLSGGQRQRIALARCLVRQRPLLLLDEPFSALDPALRRDMLDLVQGLAREHRISVVMVTHSPDDARRIADKIAVVDNGKIIAFDSTDKVLAMTEIPAIRHYLGVAISLE
uniref:thiamine ABC transporter ATP-binding protein n=1 Tax=Thaumasiovibrio occultus TaxID=1891184 RepID=UPI000B357FB5|nr:thiamine ABC transporter ATP-binding protein [Thaumasiovibrio occultus]